MRHSKGGYYTKRHSCFLLQYHMVFVTKFRNPFLTGDVKNYVYDIIRDSLKSRGSNLIDMNGEADHIHILFEAPPDEKLTELANVLKTMNNALSDIKFQIRAAGYNINQISHDSHIAVKQMEEGKIPESAFVSNKDVHALMDSIQTAMKKYEDVSNEVGQISWQLYK